MCFALQCVEKPLRWAIHTIKPLGSFVSGNVAILGDAVSTLFDILPSMSNYLESQAHAMAPHQGAGAGQAIEVHLVILENRSVEEFYLLGCIHTFHCTRTPVHDEGHNRTGA